MGSVLTLSAKGKGPSLALRCQRWHVSAIRLLVDEDLTDAEREEIIEEWEMIVSLPNGKLVVTSVDADEDEDEDERRVLVVPKGSYRLTLGSTLAGPLVNRPGKESIKKFFTRTRPAEAIPSWVDPDEESEEFWVGLIIRLERTDAPADLPKTKALPTGKNLRIPEVCPPGLPSVEPDGWRDYVQTDLHYVHDIPKLLAKRTAQPLVDGPVSLPVVDLVVAYWIPWICGETHPMVWVRGSGDFDPGWPSFKEGIRATRQEDGWRVDIEGMNARWSQFGHLRQVASLVMGVPDGTEIELACAADDSEGSKGQMRFIGAVREGHWDIQSTFPRMKGDDLRRMLELARQAEEGRQIDALSQAEADAVTELIDTKDFLLRETPPTRKGLRFQVPKNADLMPFLAARFFAARFPNVLLMIDRDDALDDWDEMMDQIAQAGAKFATGELVFEGTFAKFTKADLEALEGRNRDYISDRERWLTANAFVLLGDLHSTQTFQAVFQGYAHDELPVYAAIIENGFGSANLDFYTRFADGNSLTTSDTQDAKESSTRNRKQKSSQQWVPGGPDVMLRRHLERMAELQPSHGEPATPGDLAAFAAELDHFMARMHS